MYTRVVEEGQLGRMFVAAFVAGRILPVWAPFLGLEIRIHEVSRIEMRVAKDGSLKGLGLI